MSNSYDNEGEQLIVQEQDNTKSKFLNGKNITYIVGIIFSVAFVFGLSGIILIFFLINKIFINLPASIEAEGILPHLSRFEKIAFDHPTKSRAVAGAYNESAAYVISTLRAKTACQISTQYFNVPVYTELSEPKLNISKPFNYPLQHMVDFRQLRYGGNGKFNIQAEVLILTQTGCEASHFVNAQDKIVILEIKNVGCEPIDRAMLAEKAGAKGLLFYNSFTSKTLSWMRVRYTNWVDGSELLRIPAFSISYSTFQMINSANGGTERVTLQLESDSVVTIHNTFNIICDLPKASSDVIVAGAHLDSVPEGPGMNDDGSGSSALLEIVVQYSQRGIYSHNSLRFAWWGAEEIGLLGSRHYVRELQKTPTEFKKVKAYMNFDMLGSPNYVLGVYDGAFATNEPIRPQCAKITETFIEHFKASGNPYHKSPLISGSDFVPFVEAGVPSGGLFTGAGTLKTAEERTKFGGFPLAAYDPCYHQPCDTYENISPIAIEIHAKAAAYAIEKLASIQNVEDYLNKKF